MFYVPACLPVGRQGSNRFSSILMNPIEFMVSKELSYPFTFVVPPFSREISTG